MFEIEHCTPDCLKIQYRNTPVVYNFSRIQTDFIHLYLSESAVPHDPSRNSPDELTGKSAQSQTPFSLIPLRIVSNTLGVYFASLWNRMMEPLPRCLCSNTCLISASAPCSFQSRLSALETKIISLYYCFTAYFSITSNSNLLGFAYTLSTRLSCPIS